MLKYFEGTTPVVWQLQFSTQSLPNKKGLMYENITNPD